MRRASAQPGTYLRKKRRISSACLSPSGLNHHFKQSVGLTPMEYLAALRLTKAEALLCHTKMPLAEIAALCGFESPYYFSNTFKKHKGEAPTAYRRKCGV